MLDLAPDPDPLEAHFPTKYTSKPGVQQSVDVALPPFDPHDGILNQSREDTEIFCAELYEWLSLVRLQSPRVETGDSIDPYLSCYQVPGERGDAHPHAKVCVVSWTGFFSSRLAREILIDAMAAVPSKSWLSVSFSTFPSSKGLSGGCAECTFFRPPKSDGEYMLWEVKSHE